jgi:hypothetical protein
MTCKLVAVALSQGAHELVLVNLLLSVSLRLTDWFFLLRQHLRSLPVYHSGRSPASLLKVPTKLYTYNWLAFISLSVIQFSPVLRGLRFSGTARVSAPRLPIVL